MAVQCECGHTFGCACAWSEMEERGVALGPACWVGQQPAAKDKEGRTICDTRKPSSLDSMATEHATSTTGGGSIRSRMAFSYTVYGMVAGALLIGTQGRTCCLVRFDVAQHVSDVYRITCFVFDSGVADREDGRGNKKKHSIAFTHERAVHMNRCGWACLVRGYFCFVKDWYTSANVPTAACHWTMVPSVIVGDSAGIRTGMVSAEDSEQENK